MKSNEDVNRVRTMYRNGIKVPQIHKITGIPISTLRDWINDKTRQFNIEKVNKLMMLMKGKDEKSRKITYENYSFCYGFFVSSGKKYLENGTCKICFRKNIKDLIYFHKIHSFIFNDTRKLTDNMKYYGIHLNDFYSYELAPWQLEVLSVVKIFEGMLLGAYKNGKFYIKGAKGKFMFKGLCEQFGYSINVDGNWHTFNTKYSKEKINKILLEYNTDYVII